MMAPRRILFLTYGRDEVSCRFRVLQYVPYLQRMGIEVDVVDLHVSAGARWKILGSAAGYDSVCVHRAFLSPLEQRRLRRVAGGYIFDFDDAIMFRDSSHRRFGSWQRRLRFRRMVAGARRVIAGNRYLAEWASRFSERVTVIPTAIDLAAYLERHAELGRNASNFKPRSAKIAPPSAELRTCFETAPEKMAPPQGERLWFRSSEANAARPEEAASSQRPSRRAPAASDVPKVTGIEPSGEPVVGWIGTRINLMYLRAIMPALARLTRTRPDVNLKVVSDGFLDVAGVPVTNKRWSLAEEVDDIASFHVGIMPLPDDPWTRGKCAVKILQYFAAGVPVVCSPVGTNLDVVEHGRSGYFANAEDEWVARLEDLLGDEERRKQFAAAGREMVRRRYSIESNLEAFVDVLLG
jgi:glycosyltransferase involved in cell wall biosynthesis